MRAQENLFQSTGAFRVSLPALDHFPIGVWSELMARHSRTSARGMMAYGDVLGHLSFRKQSRSIWVPLVGYGAKHRRFC